MEGRARAKCLNILYMRICKYCSQSEMEDGKHFILSLLLPLSQRTTLCCTGSKYPHLNHSLIWTDMIIFLLIAELHFARAIREILVITWPFRNHTCRNASLVNANMSPIICRWKLVKHRYCFGDNRRTKDIRKIKAERSSYAACCVTLISCSISHNFPH